MFVTTLFANDTSARARHGEGGMMLQAMNFDYICKHVSVGEWGMVTKGQRDKEGDGEMRGGKFLIPLSPLLLVSLPSFLILHSDYVLAAAASTARLT